jgi:hypothetical protein
MSRRNKIRLQRLSELEAEFELLLIACLRECANGRYGLFGQNDHLDPEHKIWDWAESRRVLELADEIQTMGSESGETNLLCERFMHFRSLRSSNTLGEPKLAKLLLDELSGSRHS